MRSHFHLFVYGTLQRGGSPNSKDSLLEECEQVGRGSVGGVLYDVDGEFPAMVMYGTAPIEGEVWRCPTELLPLIDSYEGVDDGMFRRVGVEVPLTDANGRTDERANGRNGRNGRNETVPCWTYVAGPGLGRKLTKAHRISSWQK